MAKTFKSYLHDHDSFVVVAAIPLSYFIKPPRGKKENAEGLHAAQHNGKPAVDHVRQTVHDILQLYDGEALGVSAREDVAYKPMWKSFIDPDHNFATIESVWRVQITSTKAIIDVLEDNWPGMPV